MAAKCGLTVGLAASAPICFVRRPVLQTCCEDDADYVIDGCVLCEFYPLGLRRIFHDSKKHEAIDVPVASRKKKRICAIWGNLGKVTGLLI